MSYLDYYIVLCTISFIGLVYIVFKSKKSKVLKDDNPLLISMHELKRGDIFCRNLKLRETTSFLVRKNIDNKIECTSLNFDLKIYYLDIDGDVWLTRNIYK